MYSVSWVFLIFGGVLWAERVGGVSTGIGDLTSIRQKVSNCESELLKTQYVRSFDKKCSDLLDNKSKVLGRVCFTTNKGNDIKPLKVKFEAASGSRLKEVSVGAYSNCGLVPDGNKKFTKTEKLSSVKKHSILLRTESIVANRNCCERELCLVVAARVIKSNGTSKDVEPDAVCPVKGPGKGDGHTCRVMMNCVNVIKGTKGDDKLDGTEFVDYIYGYGGNDRLRGFGANDKLFGGDGDDRIFAGEGDDRVYLGDGDDAAIGDPGDDVIFGGDGNDRIDGQEGDDFLYGEGGYDTLYGGEGKDNLYGGDEDDRLYGGDDDDILRGGDYRDILNGGDGDDDLNGDADEDVLRGDDGNDVLRDSDKDSVAGYASNALYGGDGNDDLRDTADNSKLDGGNGNDNLVGGGSQFGGKGKDKLSAGGYGGLYQSGGPGDDFISNDGGNFYRDVTLEIRGDDGDDTIDITAFVNPKNVYGGEGDDEINFRGFSDSILGEKSKVFGEAGNDDITASWVIYNNDYYLEHIAFFGGPGEDTLNGKPLTT
ncbi:hypothetical protein NDN08_003741 [Rhodosorus marinus]|uniref:Calcium-binding protein n=1 Tax=Rhodosorus marinus TaxID=101924 RepID=A0AAV8UXD7_9RHOD|nr:hypothetical protein NDN08_003741 [Rhodosorus marinus]